ncbi:hypothetical protein HKX48_006911, partial [Thoreauomyces humboldtii]
MATPHEDMDAAVPESTDMDIIPSYESLQKSEGEVQPSLADTPNAMDVDPLDVSQITAGGASPLPELAKSPLDIDTILPMDSSLEEEVNAVSTWHIEDLAALRTEQRKFGPEFEAGGLKWRILLFPNGNKQQDVLSVFLDCVDAHDNPDPEWHRCVSFAISVMNPRDPTRNVTQNAIHRFNPQSTDWGFNSMCPQSRLYTGDDNKGLPVMDADDLDIVVWIRIMHDETGVLWHKFENWDSRERTGFVGLKNQGATCYMNSVLQSLYFTNYFRKATFEIPTENEDPSKSIVLAMQRIFYNLQFSPNAVSTTELTKSFGWDAIDSFAQHDVQEFNRVLQDNLESKMKGTKAEGAITRLFVGKMKSYIKCVNVDYESSRKEDFYDIQLNVKGCKNLKESFDEYVSVENMDGENKYAAEGFGLQDAKKGVIFESFPPVLHLQLKRFEYDFQRDVLIKINDRHEYPSEIEVDGYLAEEADRTVKQKYHLHGVLVHSGDLHGGHYCAFLRPTTGEKWFKFDDDRVIPATRREVFDENFGGEFPSMRQGIKLKRFTNAYMLVYVRDSDRAEVLAEVTKDDIPSHLQKRLEEERIQQEAETKEREEAYLYLTVRVVREEDIAQHEGFDLWNFSHPLPCTYRVLKSDTLAAFKQTVGEKLSLHDEDFRFWSFIGRQNKTTRPDQPLLDMENMRMEAILNKLGKHSNELKLYLELVKDPNVIQLPPVENSMEPGLMLWLKYYDPVQLTLHVIGRIYVENRETRLGDIIPFLVKKANLPEDTPLKLFEEIKPDMIDLLKPKATFSSGELGDGDILCFQRDLTPQEAAELPDPNQAEIPAYFEALRNRVTVTFKEKGHDRENGTSIVLSKKMNYANIATQLAKRIGAEAEKIRLLVFVPPGHPPNRGTVIKYSATWYLELAISARGIPVHDPNSAGEDAGTLIYEVLGIRVKELESKRYLKIWWVDKKNKEQGPFDILIPKSARVADLHAAVAEKIRDGHIKVEAGSDVLQATKFRVFELGRDSRVGKQYSEVDYVDTIKDSSEIYVEEILAQEVSQPLLQVFHYTKDPIRGHGVPFFLALNPGEPFSETRRRLQARLGMNDKEFAKVKFQLVEMRGKVQQVEDEDILADFPRTDEWSLGVDHVDRSARGGRLGGFEKAIKIF